jgi:hypothetical protein
MNCEKRSMTASVGLAGAGRASLGLALRDQAHGGIEEA